MNKKIIYVLFAIVILGILLSALAKSEEKNKSEPDNLVGEEYIAYKSGEYSPEFIYPRYWGDVTLREGNSFCPEEDTYRTPDTLRIFDWEYSFRERNLPNSESMIRSGIRIYELDPKNLNNCGDDFLLKIAKNEVAPETISSFRLSSVTLPSGLMGIYNPEASRLNTESRTQYTLFIPSGEVFYILQPYMSFIPYFDSKELRELEQDFNGDMEKYLSTGITSSEIRKQRHEFNATAESLRFRAE